MRDDTIAAFLDQLAARVPAPGGGATAALHAAQAAALLAMVARYSEGPRYDAELINRIITEADGLREDALALAEADAEAFGAVAQAYDVVCGLPHASSFQRAVTRGLPAPQSPPVGKLPGEGCKPAPGYACPGAVGSASQAVAAGG